MQKPPHWYLLDSPYYYDCTAWSHVRPWTRCQAFGDTAARVLCPELFLLHLCAHQILQNRGAGPARWYDIVALLHDENTRIDWTLVCDLAQRFRLVLSLQQTLRVVEQEWEGVLSAAERRRIARLPVTDRERVGIG